MRTMSWVLQIPCNIHMSYKQQFMTAVLESLHEENLSTTAYYHSVSYGRQQSQ